MLVYGADKRVAEGANNYVNLMKHVNYLLRLLAQNRIAEFHTELELIPTELQHSNIYIKYPAQLEQHIMEGSYNKVLSAKNEGVFQKEGMYFMDMLVDTVREEIADCSEKAYASIKAADLQGLLMFTSAKELSEFGHEMERDGRKPEAERCYAQAIRSSPRAAIGLRGCGGDWRAAGTCRHRNGFFLLF